MLNLCVRISPGIIRVMEEEEEEEEEEEKSPFLLLLLLLFFWRKEALCSLALLKRKEIAFTYQDEMRIRSACAGMFDSNLGRPLSLPIYHRSSSGVVYYRTQRLLAVIPGRVVIIILAHPHSIKKNKIKNKIKKHVFSFRNIKLTTLKMNRLLTDGFRRDPTPPQKKKNKIKSFRTTFRI